MGFTIQHGFRIGQLEVYPRYKEISGPRGSINLGSDALSLLVALAEQFPDTAPVDELLRALPGFDADDLPQEQARLLHALDELTATLAQYLSVPDLVDEVGGGYRLLVPIEPVDAVADYAAGYDPYYVDDESLPDVASFDSGVVQVRTGPPVIAPAPVDAERATGTRNDTADARRLRIFVSSPGDVREERTVVRAVIDRLQEEIGPVATLEPVFWEEEPLLATGTFQTQLIRPSDCDVMIAILWSRLGTPLSVDLTRPDGTRYASGTEFEFEDAVRGFRENGKPQLLVYRKTSVASVALDDERTLLDRVEQKKKLDDFINRWFHHAEDGSLTGAFHPFETREEFEQLLEGHLRKIIHRILPETANCRPHGHGEEDGDEASGFISRMIRDLHERRVFRVIFGYPVAAWVVLQVADVLANYFGMETRDFQPLLAVLIGGYPLAIFLAWLLQITRQGLVIHPRHKDAQGRIIPLRPLAVGLSAGLMAVGIGIWSHSFMQRSAIGDCERTIAVMPFENFSQSENDAYLGKGFAEELLHKLAQIEEMKVASRTASFNFKTENMDVKEIGRRLGVCHLLEGSVRRQGNMLRITAQLIDVRSNYHMWSRTYDRKMADLFAVYDEIAVAITEKLRISFGDGTARQPEALVTNMDAYDHYLQGRSILERADDESRVARADRLFARALEFDPEYARALAGRCEANTLLYEFSRSVQWFEDAERYCRQALRADDSLADVRVALARLFSLAGRQDDALRELDSAKEKDADNPDIWRHLGQVYAARGASDAAESAFQRALQISSWDVRIYQELGAFYFDIGRYDRAVEVYAEMVDKSGGSSAAYTGLGASLTIQGAFDEAAAAFRMAIQNDPNPRTYSNAGSAYFYQGRFEDAALMMQEAVELSPEDFRLVGNLADALRFLPGRAEDAKDLYQRAVDLAEAALTVNPDELDVVYMLPHFYSQLGRSQEARDAIGRALALGPDHNYVYYYAGLAWLELGEEDRALDAFRKAVELGYPWKLLDADPQLETMSSSREFRAIASDLQNPS